MIPRGGRASWAPASQRRETSSAAPPAVTPPPPPSLLPLAPPRPPAAPPLAHSPPSAPQLTPSSGTASRDAYYRWVCNTSAALPAAGVNFWAWGGEGRPGSAEAAASALVPSAELVGAHRQPTPLAHGTRFLAEAGRVTTKAPQTPRLRAFAHPRTSARAAGDPPHERPGWYSVYDVDKATHAAIAECAARFALPPPAAAARATAPPPPPLPPPSSSRGAGPEAAAQAASPRPR